MAGGLDMQAPTYVPVLGGLGNHEPQVPEPLPCDLPCAPRFTRNRRATPASSKRQPPCRISVPFSTAYSLKEHQAHGDRLAADPTPRKCQLTGQSVQTSYKIFTVGIGKQEGGCRSNEGEVEL